MVSATRKMSKGQRRAVSLIRKARKAGWTLEELASHLKASFSSVSRWENGIAAPYPNTAERIITVLEDLAMAR